MAGLSSLGSGLRWSECESGGAWRCRGKRKQTDSPCGGGHPSQRSAWRLPRCGDGGAIGPRDCCFDPMCVLQIFTQNPTACFLNPGSGSTNELASGGTGCAIGTRARGQLREDGPVFRQHHRRASRGRVDPPPFFIPPRKSHPLAPQSETVGFSYPT